MNHRPYYHFHPPSGWLSDPNGLILWHGQYHLFYQHNPIEAKWGNIHWGHAVSSDLVQWKHMPIALSPTDEFDSSGCWSGCAVADGEELKLIYTAVRDYCPEQDSAHIQIRLASSYDGIHFVKHQAVLMEWPWGSEIAGHRLTGFRDPYVWRQGRVWRMLIGAGIAGRGGAALLYESENLTEWRYLGLLVVGDVQRHEPIWTGSVWECPFLLGFSNPWDIGDELSRHALIMSVWHERIGLYTAYLSGAYLGDQLKVLNGGKLDWGDAFYASQALRDEHGNWVLFGWLRELRNAREQIETGWSGVISLPRVLSLEEGKIRQRPHPHLERLRREYWQFLNVHLSKGSLETGIRGEALEVDLEMMSNTGQYGLKMYWSGGQTSIYYEVLTRELVVDKGLDNLIRAPIEVKESLRLHIFLDASVLEVFTVDGQVITTRIYPSEEPNLALMASEGATAKLAAWKLATIWRSEA